MPTYRPHGSGSSSVLDIVASSPAEAVSRAQDMEPFRSRPRPLKFDVYEITGYDRQRFQSPKRR